MEQELKEKFDEFVIKDYDTVCQFCGIPFNAGSNSKYPMYIKSGIYTCTRTTSKDDPSHITHDIKIDEMLYGQQVPYESENI